MLNAFKAFLLATFGMACAAQPNSQPCLSITGGFLKQQVAPHAAIEKARNEIWKAYTKHLIVCVDLRVYSREGRLSHTIFRCQVSDRVWRAEIAIKGPTSAEIMGRTPTYIGVLGIHRLEISSNQKPGDGTLKDESHYRLRLHLSDGRDVDI